MGGLSHGHDVGGLDHPSTATTPTTYYFRCETAITTDVTTFDNKSHRNMSLEIIVRKFN